MISLGTLHRAAMLSAAVLIGARAGMPAWEAYAADPAPAEEAEAETPAPAAPAPVLPELLAALAAEREALAARKASLDTREAEAKIAEEAIGRQLSELRKLRDELAKSLEQAGNGHEGDVTSLVGIYSMMKPAEAASIINDLDLEVATLLISAMKQADSGPIMAQMEPDRARLISKIMFERSRLPGDRKPVQVPARGD